MSGMFFVGEYLGGQANIGGHTLPVFGGWLGRFCLPVFGFAIKTEWHSLPVHFAARALPRPRFDQ